MKIDVRKPTEEEIAIFANYPIWECEPSEFPWSYNSTEQCLVLEGEVTVVAEEGETSIGPGALVTFPSGLSGTWKVVQAGKQRTKCALEKMLGRGYCLWFERERSACCANGMH